VECKLRNERPYSPGLWPSRGRPRSPTGISRSGKKEFGDALKLEGALARQLGLFLRENADYFLSFEKVIVYYDNGQTEVTRTLNSVFNAFFFDVDVRNVKPQDYRLFQAADLFCTLELLRAKAEDNALSRSDLFFFRTKQALQKDYLRKIIKKRFGP
jgi:hypothetical protein